MLPAIDSQALVAVQALAISVPAEDEIATFGVAVSRQKAHQFVMIMNLS